MTGKTTSRKTPGLVVLFGSGEMSPTGRKIHEAVFKRLGFVPPVSVGILETPTGFEVNAIHAWPERMEDFFKKSLKNYSQVVSRIRAWRRDGIHSTNDSTIVDVILLQNYLYSGAGSPTYTVRNLVKSRAYINMVSALKHGTTLCLGSASAIAAGRYALPVYEIFKAGEGLHWINGLNLLGTLGMNVAVVLHWNNKEGEDFDTTHCWMGKARFKILSEQLPTNITMVGIDEQTALVIDPLTKKCDVFGVGSVHIITRGKEKIIPTGASFNW